jgi:hypothetical protein
MPSRYENVLFFRNTNSLYFPTFENRGVRYIDQYGTVTFERNNTNKPRFSIETVYWEYGDRLDKLASQAYGDATYWWVIARYNHKPTDAHYSLGDKVLIPQPLQMALDIYLT